MKAFLSLHYYFKDNLDNLKKFEVQEEVVQRVSLVIISKIGGEGHFYLYIIIYIIILKIIWTI